MMRLIAAVIVVFLLPVRAMATLVVIVPYSDGLVIAADSLTTIFGTHCDDQFKITQLKHPSRTVLAITGAIAFVPQPASGASCSSLKSAPHLLDVSDVVARELEHHRGNIANLSLEELSATCVSAVERFQKANPMALAPYAGKDIFSVVIASYDRRSKSSILLNFVIRIDAKTHEIRADRLTRTRIALHDRRGIWSFGESGYLNSSVFAGLGRKYLCKSTLDFILKDKPVAAAPKNEAVATAVNVIEAATRTARDITPAQCHRRPDPRCPFRLPAAASRGATASHQRMLRCRRPTLPVESWENGTISRHDQRDCSGTPAHPRDPRRNRPPASCGAD
jgi:hypothetical protein